MHGVIFTTAAKLCSPLSGRDFEEVLPGAGVALRTTASGADAPLPDSPRRRLYAELKKRFVNTRGEAVAAERTGGEPRELFCRRQKSEQKTFCEAECLRAISPRAKRQSRKRRTLLLKIRFACHKSFIDKQGVQGEACVPLQTSGLLSAEPDVRIYTDV